VKCIEARRLRQLAFYLQTAGGLCLAAARDDIGMLVAQEVISMVTGYLLLPSPQGPSHVHHYHAAGAGTLAVSSPASGIKR